MRRLAFLAAVLACASAARQLTVEEWEGIENLDLSKMKAHMETPTAMKVSPPLHNFTILPDP